MVGNGRNTGAAEEGEGAEEEVDVGREYHLGWWVGEEVQ